MTTRPFDGKDLAGILAALTNSNPTPGNQNHPSTLFKLVNTQDLNQLIADANANQIQAQVDEQLAKPTDQPTCQDCAGTPPGEMQGYAAGLYFQNSGDSNDNDKPVGVLANWNSNHVDFKLNDDGQTFSALFKLRVGEPGGNKGGIDILFGDKTSPTENPHSFTAGGGLFAYAPPGA